MANTTRNRDLYDVKFYWNDPVGSIRLAQVLPEDLTLNFLVHYLSLSKPTIYRLRATKGFPNPSGPNSRVVYYSKTEVLIWLLKECGVIGQLENTYTDKEHNIYLSLYADSKVPLTSSQNLSVPISSSQLVSVRLKTDEIKPISDKEFLKVILEHGFDMHFFQGHLEELLPMFAEKSMTTEVIHKICSDVKNRSDLNIAGQDSLLLTYFRNHGGAKKGRRKTKKEAKPSKFMTVDYDALINHLNNYE